MHTLPSSVRGWGGFESVCWIVCMSIREKACGGILTCGALAVAFGAACTNADAGVRGFYVALGGELGVASFGFPSVKIHGVPGAMLGVTGSREQPVRFLGLDLSAPAPLGGFEVSYLPRYRRSVGLSGALGYGFGPLRLQLGTYSGSFGVDGGGHAVSNNSSWFAFPSGEGFPNGGPSAGYSVGEVLEVGLSSVELSACYSSFSAAGGSFGLYSCLGLGVSSVDYWGLRGGLALSWSGRTGVEYTLSSGFTLFAEAYYLGANVEERTDGGGPVLRTVGSSMPSDGGVGVLPALSTGYFGGVTGVRYAFDGSF